MELVLIPLALFLVCGAVQGVLAAKLKGAAARAFLGLLPLAGLAVLLYTIYGYVNATGWDGIAWFFYLMWAACALGGTLLGWLIGILARRRRKKRQKSGENSALEGQDSCNGPENSV